MVHGPRRAERVRPSWREGTLLAARRGVPVEGLCSLDPDVTSGFLLGAEKNRDLGTKGGAMFKGAVLRYLISDALSMLGNSIAGVVLPLVLLARTGDVLAAGSFALICAVPQFVFGLLGGAVLDRVDRKLVCVVSDLVSALSIALLPIVDEVWGLSFGWFVALGLLGAVGDVPGMTARDALLPAVCRHEGVDLQRFVGASQSLASFTTIAGPAAAALLMGALGDIDALWVTAACSCLVSAVSATLPREVGAVSAAVPADTADASADSAPTGFSALAAAPPRRSPTASRPCSAPMPSCARASCSRSASPWSWGAGRASCCPRTPRASPSPSSPATSSRPWGVGMLAGSVGYTAVARLLSRRAWLVVSLAGMALGVATVGRFPAVPVLLAAAAAVGLFAGPASALLGFFAFDRVSDERRGSAMGTLNALYLVAHYSKSRPQGRLPHLQGITIEPCRWSPTDRPGWPFRPRGNLHGLGAAERARPQGHGHRAHRGLDRCRAGGRQVARKGPCARAARPDRMPARRAKRDVPFWHIPLRR